MATGSGSGVLGTQVLIGGAVVGAGALATALFVLSPGGDDPGARAPQPEVPQQAVLSPDAPQVPADPVAPAKPVIAAGGAATAPAETSQPQETIAQDAAPDEDNVAAPAPPVIDLVRIEADGTAVLAGTAAADVAVRLDLDGRELTRVAAGGDGKFVAFVDIPPTAKPRLLSAAMLWNDKWIEARQSVIVAAQPVPAEVAPPVETVQAEVQPVDEGVAAVAEGSAAAENADRTGDVALGQVGESANEELSAGAPRKTPERTPLAEPVAATSEGQVAEAEPVPDAGSETTAQATADTAEAGSDLAEAVEAATQTPVVADGADAAQTELSEALPEATTEVAARTGRVSEGTAPTLPAGDETAGTSPAPQPPEAEPVPVAPAVLVADADGVRVIQPAPGVPSPQVMSTVALDTISYDETGEVNLAGRGAGAGGFVRVYLDNAPVTTSRIARDGSWRADLPEVDTGVYTLRVDEVDEAGAVTSRVETPFKREDPVALAEARAEAAQGDAPLTVVTVQPGASLWAIAQSRYGSGYLYVKVFEANKDRIRNPDLIYPGQVFDLPGQEDVPAGQ